MYQYGPENAENNELENSPEDLQRYGRCICRDWWGASERHLRGFRTFMNDLLCRKCIETTRQEGLKEEDDDIFVYDVMEVSAEDPPAPAVVVNRCSADRGRNAVRVYVSNYYIQSWRNSLVIAYKYRRYSRENKKC